MRPLQLITVAALNGCAIAAMLLVGCETDPTADKTVGVSRSQRETLSGGAPVGRAPDDWMIADATGESDLSGLEWGEIAALPPRGGTGSTGGSPLPDIGALVEEANQPEIVDPAAAEAATPTSNAAPTRLWVVVLRTFSGDGHKPLAEQFLAQSRALAPQLVEARVHTTASGSMIILGGWAQPRDPAAQETLKSIKSIAVNGQTPFARAQLGPVRVTTMAQARNPYDLMSVRARNPNLNPIYTLEVAVWSDFGAGVMTPDEVRRRAEAYCRSLRARDVEAYFYHDTNKNISSVTVGLYSKNAIDPRSGLRSPELQAAHDQFPARLVNGDMLNEPIYRRFPERGTRVQPAQLVEVPRL